MKNLLILFGFVLTFLVGGCRGEDPEIIFGTDLAPMSWDIDNRASEKVKVLKSDKLTYQISSEKSEGHVIFTNTNKFVTFENVTLEKRDMKTHDIEETICKYASKDNGKVISSAILINQEVADISSEDLPLTYSSDWCKIHINYPVVDIEFVPFDGVVNSYINISFSGNVHLSDFILTRE